MHPAALAAVVGTMIRVMLSSQISRKVLGIAVAEHHLASRDTHLAT